MSGPRVVVAMSGGVDSSVAAALLLQQGYEVIGMMMRLWSEPGMEDQNRCCTPDALAQARRVANQLNIPFYAVDARVAFYDAIVTNFVSDYAQGLTPNPCINCNRHIRWTFLLQRALSIGAQFMATGHYVRLVQQEGIIRLQQAVDLHKDQSYVLHVLTQEQLKHALFPLGGYTKPQVRQLARDFNLPVAERAESQDLCFLGEGDYRSFLERNSPNIKSSGPIFASDGKLLGEHHGLAFYTIGQRKGIPVNSSTPLYVIRKDMHRNALIVGKLEDLGQDHLTAEHINWVDGNPPLQSRHLMVKIRYKAQPVRALVTPLPDQSAYVQFEQNLRDITPGQAAVFYDQDMVVGGGIIRPESHS